MLELNSPGVDAVDGMLDRYVFVRVPADQHDGDGYPRFSLRDDVANTYREVYDKVHEKGGILTSSGGIRSLRAKVNASRSATSFHYSGRALDLYIYSGMVDVETDPYVISRRRAREYRVFARCSKKYNPQADLPEVRTVEHAITYKDRIQGVTVEGHFLDLTAWRNTKRLLSRNRSI